MNFVNGLKYADVKILTLCIDVYKTNEGDDYGKIFEVLSTLRKKKLKINNTLIEKFGDVLENPDFEQEYWAKTAKGNYKIGHDSIRLMKRTRYYDRSCYENIIYYDLMGSILSCLNEISKR